MVERISKKAKTKTPSVRERIERNKWNPFERVDPEILQRIHKQYEANAKKHFLDQVEPAIF